MDTSSDPRSEQTDDMSFFDDVEFKLVDVPTTTSADLGGQDEVKADVDDGGRNALDDDLFDFFSPTLMPTPVTNERQKLHPDLLIDIGESDTDNLCEEEKKPVEDSDKTESMEHEIEETWMFLDAATDGNDDMNDDMLFGSDLVERKSSCGQQQVPDIIADDVAGGTPDLIHSHESRMDEVEDDVADVFDSAEDVDGNVNNNAWPFRKQHDSSQSSEHSAPEGGHSSGDTEDQMDFSVIQDTNRLDVKAVKQKSLLRKKGSLALRKKPTRSSMKRCLSDSESQRFIDSTEPKLSVTNGIDEDEVDEPYRKSNTQPESRISVQGSKPKMAMGAFAPNLSQINSSKVFSGAHKKALNNSSFKKDNRSNSFDRSLNNSTEKKEAEPAVKLKPIAATAPSDINTSASSSKPKLIFESQSNSNENIFPKLKPILVKPKPVETSEVNTKPKIRPRTLSKRHSKDPKDTQVVANADRSVCSEASLDAQFDELIARIEQSDITTAVTKTVERNEKSNAQTDTITSPAVSRSSNKYPKSSSVSEPGSANFDFAPSSAEQRGTGGDQQVKPSTQPPWAKRKLKCTEDQSKKVAQQEQEQGPVWLKAAQEKKQRAAEIIIVREQRNQENSAKTEEDEEKKTSPWLGERQLRKTARPKPLTENLNNNITVTQPYSDVSNNNVENIVPTSNGAAHRLTPQRSPVRKEESSSPMNAGKNEYAPSWIRGSKLKSASTPNLLHMKVSVDHRPAAPCLTGEIPQWKKDLVNRKKTRRESDVQNGANKDSSQDQSPGMIWKLQQKKKRPPVTVKVEIEKNVPKEPEWKRTAEEKRTRFLKSGMIEHK